LEVNPKMTTEQELKDQCTPEIIKRMVELAEGFEYSLDHVIYIIYTGGIIPCKHDVLKNPENTLIFSTLIHRAVEGWNKKNGHNRNIIMSNNFIGYYDGIKTNITDYNFPSYQPQSLTLCECACLDCLLDIFKEEKK